MFVLGVVLVVLAVLAALGVFVSGSTAAAPLSMFGLTVHGTTVPAVFLAGIVVTAIFFIGLALLSSGARRSRRRRKETRDGKRDEVARGTSTAEPGEENSRLEDDLAKERGQGQKNAPTS